MDAILTKQGLVGGGVFGSFWRCSKKGLAHVLVSSYEATEVLVCEKLFINKKATEAIKAKTYNHRLTLNL